MAAQNSDGNDKPDLVQKISDFLDKIPGLKGFRDRDHTRDQDKILRTYTAEQITKLKALIDQLKSDLLSQGKIGLLDDLEQLTKKLDRARDTHRFDAYGFSGIFDPNSVTETELAALFDYDRKILAQVELADQTIAALGSGLTELAVKEALPGLRAAVGSLLEQILQRKNVLTKLGEL